MFRRMLWLCLVLPSPMGKAAQIYAGPDTFARIGSGLESVSNQWRSPCVEGSLEPAAANRSLTMRMYASQSASEILEDERGYGSLKVDFWVLGAKARSEFILRNSESRTQASMMWSVDYRGASVVMNKRQLNDRGRLALSRSPAEQRQLCGDQFILGAALGAKFYLAASLIFDSEVKYRYFKTKVSASAFGGLLKKDRTSIDEVRRAAQNATLSVQAFQLGGDTFDLDLLSASQIAYCSMDQLDPCLDRFTALHRYAFGPDGFKKQAATPIPSKLAVLWLQSSSYEDAGFFLSEASAAEDPGFVLLSEQLFDWSMAVQQSIARAQAKPLDDVTRQELATLDRAAAAIREAAALCSDQANYEACKSRMDSIQTMVASP